LPRALRQTQTFVHSEAELQRLCNFVKKALPSSVQSQATQRGESKNTDVHAPSIVATPLTQTPLSPIGAIPAPEVKTSLTQTGDSATQTWIRKIDKLSWLPFAVVVLIRVYFLVILPLNASAMQRFSIWLALLVFGILPSIVIASSFFNYPKRRILEASISVVCIVGVVLEYWGVVYINFPVVIMILLLVIGAAIKIWLLINSRRLKQERQPKTT
jgi:hypothetical protein